VPTARSPISLHPPIADLRRQIPTSVWLANRARNALRRPAFIGAISVGTFVTALVSLVVVPRAQQRTPVVKTAPRPDTLTLAGDIALARLHIAEADSALAATRQELIARQAPPIVPDSLAATAVSGVNRDSIAAVLQRYNVAITRAEQAPLASSYRALADLPELRNDPRVRALLDSLADIEREREGFGAVGGVDPIFVALTSRANEIGRALVAIALERRAKLRQTVDDVPTPVAVADSTPAVDTLKFLAARDSLTRMIQSSGEELAARRRMSVEMDLQEERARERASALAPPLALLASAFVLSAVVGFAVAFIGELRRPRIADANEVERILGTRVLSSVETMSPAVDRSRRQADRAAPPYLDPSAEGYQLAYLGLATAHPTVLMALVTGEDPSVAAVVAGNLAAVAAEEARNTLLVDLTRTCRASAALQARAASGVTDMISGRIGWPEATTRAAVGRDKTVDFVPSGVGEHPAPAALTGFLQEHGSRLTRYYDAALFVADYGDVAAGIAAALPIPEVVFCVEPGITPLKAVRESLLKVREQDGIVRGVVLWNAPRPLLASPRELAARPNKPSAGRKRAVPATA